jgi:hypothetical protein
MMEEHHKPTQYPYTDCHGPWVVMDRFPVGGAVAQQESDDLEGVKAASKTLVTPMPYEFGQSLQEPSTAVIHQ